METHRGGEKRCHRGTENKDEISLRGWTCVRGRWARRAPLHDGASLLQIKEGP